MGDLASLQSWFQAVISQPEGPAGHPDLDPERFVRGTSRLTSLDRLAIYHRGYYARLIECMRVAHPALRHALGDELFDGFAFDYLREHPSRSYTLARLDERLPAFLEATRPRDELWPRFIVDLARVERLFAEVYDGEGTEAEPVLAAADLPPVPDRAWLDTVLRPVPSLRLLASSFPVGRYLTAVTRGEHPELPDPAETFIVLVRRDYVVRLTELDRSGFAVLSAIAAGTPVGLAGADRVWELVLGWAGQGFFRAKGDCQSADAATD